MTKKYIKNICILKQCLGTQIGHMILISTVIADVKLAIHDTQVCKNTNKSKKLGKGIQEQGNDRFLYVQTNIIQ